MEAGVMLQKAVSLLFFVNNSACKVCRCFGMEAGWILEWIWTGIGQVLWGIDIC